MNSVIEKPIIFSIMMVKEIRLYHKTNTRRVIKVQPPTHDYRISTLIDTTGNRKNIGKHQWVLHDEENSDIEDVFGGYFSHPYEIGMRLWVKETHYLYGYWVNNGRTKTGKQKWTFKYERSQGVRYFDSHPSRVCKGRNEHGWFKRPAIFMPRWASRIDLEVTDFRWEWLQAIDDLGALDEGVPDCFFEQIKSDMRTSSGIVKGPFLTGTPVEAFSRLWDSINGKRNGEIIDGVIVYPYSWAANPAVWVTVFKVLKK